MKPSVQLQIVEHFLEKHSSYFRSPEEVEARIGASHRRTANQQARAGRSAVANAKALQEMRRSEQAQSARVSGTTQESAQPGGNYIPGTTYHADREGAAQQIEAGHGTPVAGMKTITLPDGTIAMGRRPGHGTATRTTGDDMINTPGGPMSRSEIFSGGAPAMGGMSDGLQEAAGSAYQMDKAYGKQFAAQESAQDNLNRFYATGQTATPEAEVAPPISDGPPRFGYGKPAPAPVESAPALSAVPTLAAGAAGQPAAGGAVDYDPDSDVVMNDEAQPGTGEEPYTGLYDANGNPEGHPDNLWGPEGEARKRHEAAVAAAGGYKYPEPPAAEPRPTPIEGIAHEDPSAMPQPAELAAAGTAENPLNFDEAFNQYGTSPKGSQGNPLNFNEAFAMHGTTPTQPPTTVTEASPYPNWPAPPAEEPPAMPQPEELAAPAPAPVGVQADGTWAKPPMSPAEQFAQTAEAYNAGGTPTAAPAPAPAPTAAPTPTPAPGQRFKGLADSTPWNPSKPAPSIGGRSVLGPTPARTTPTGGAPASAALFPKGSGPTGTTPTGGAAATPKPPTTAAATAAPKSPTVF